MQDTDLTEDEIEDLRLEKLREEAEDRDKDLAETLRDDEVDI